MTTPRPNLYLFNESPRLVSKKCRTSTPNLRPPKPPTKSSKQKQNRQRNQNHDLHEGSFSYGLLYQQFDIISKIGSGYFGMVYKAKSLNDGQYYAIKKIADRSRKLQEVRNHESLPPHPNCVKYYDSWEEDGCLYIQTELCKTSLNEILDASDDHKLPECIIWKYLIDLLLAVKHLHDHDLLHLDIKPDNIFISFDDVAKLGDFGLMCNVVDHNDSGIQNTPDEGDSKYLANETMQGKFTKAADIFSLGITIFEVASGLDLPQRGESYYELRHNKIEDIHLNGLSAELVKVIKLMMEEDYTKRPSVDELLRMTRLFASA